MSGITAGNVGVLDGVVLLPYSSLVWWSSDPVLAIVLYCQSDDPLIFFHFLQLFTKIDLLKHFDITEIACFCKI